MITWRLLTDEEARKTWDGTLITLDDYSTFQTYAWGEYRRAFGWEPYHWAAFDDDGTVVAMLLGLVRRYPFKLGLVWSEGGPVGDISVCGDGLQQVIKESTGLKRVYCRFRCDRERSTLDALTLNGQGWSRSWFNLTPNLSMQLELLGDVETTLRKASRNWRRNLRKANGGTLTTRLWTNPSAGEIHSIYQSMQSAKGIDEQMSLDEIRQLLNSCKANLVLYRCDDKDGSLLSVLGWLVLGNRCWAVLQATSERGRTLNASYAVFEAVMRDCIARRVDSCDLAGIDPIKNSGCYRFKRDTGATHLEYLGEWDWATSAWLKWCGNWAISRRDKLKRTELELKGTRRLGFRESLSQRSHAHAVSHSPKTQTAA